MKKSLSEFPSLVAEFHPVKNATLTPEDLRYGSNQKVWWVCPNGHEYQTTVRNRTSRRVGCPYCAGKRVDEYNSLQATVPEVAKDWDLKANLPLTPENVSKFSNKRVWWECSKGHKWQAAIASRTRGTGCPECSGRKVGKDNNLSKLFPHLADEWHPSKNLSLKPSDITPGSQKKIWWSCDKKHEWTASVASRTRGAGCPFCANKRVSKDNNLLTVSPKVAADWHPTKNINLRPQDVVNGSHKKVWWKCREGHEWQSTIKSVTNGKGCPICRK
jgi:hypothetical protein